jgi:hypothetical protein
MSKSAHYYYDAEAIAEPFVSGHPSGNGFVRPERLSFLEADGTPRGNPNGWQPPSYNGSSFTTGKTAAPRASVGQGERKEHAGRNRRSVWTIPTHPFKEAHFATFPEDLVTPCVLAGARRGDTILDPFAGAGTVGLVARRNGNPFIGIELNPEYCEIAARRLRQSVFDFAGPNASEVPADPALHEVPFSSLLPID